MRRKIGRSVANQPDDPAAAGNPSTEAPSWFAEVPGTIRVEHVGAALREYFRRYATSDSDVDSAELIVAELVANVQRHARGSASFHLDWRGRRPRLLVLDGGPGFQGPLCSTLPTDLYAESGRGLAIVRALAVETEFGNRPDGGGFASVTLPVERSLDRP
jgi:anti-sigma regulatory factor (Ser/Thr protein kinase)